MRLKATKEVTITVQEQTVEKRANSVDEAIQSALEELNCGINDVEVEILEEGNKGLLGIFGKTPCHVRVSLKEKPELEVKELAEHILDLMQIRYQIDTLTHNDGTVRINFVGDDMGLLIGRRGETLNAMQMLMGIITNRQREEKHLRILLDVENYRLNREKSIAELALKLADKVKHTGENVVMRTMSAQERRIVHTALQDDKEITTYSTNEEPHRRVVIALKNS